MVKQHKLYVIVFILQVFIFLAYPTLAAAANVLVYKNEYKEGIRDLEYPYFDGMDNKDAQNRMNQKIQQIVDQCMKEDKYTKDVKLRFIVHLNEGNKVSISINQYVYAGGAHGSSSLVGYTFNLDTGEEYRFSDLFKFDSDSVQNINRLIEGQIRERNIVIFEPFQGLTREPDFYLEAGKRVVIIFQHYEIAPYSSGILEFPFNY